MLDFVVIFFHLSFYTSIWHFQYFLHVLNVTGFARTYDGCVQIFRDF